MHSVVSLCPAASHLLRLPLSLLHLCYCFSVSEGFYIRLNFAAVASINTKPHKGSKLHCRFAKVNDYITV